MTKKGLRKLKQEYRKSPILNKAEKLFRATDQLQAKLSISEHVSRGLQETIQLQKRKKGGSILTDLTGKELESGALAIWSPDRWGKALEYQDELARQEEAEEKADKAAQDRLRRGYG